MKIWKLFNMRHEKMGKYSEETIKKTRNLISKGEYGLVAQIKNLEVWFCGDTLEKVTDEMIEFALDIVNAYQRNKEKYDGEALAEVKNCLCTGEKVDDSAILYQLGTPIIDVTTENGACLWYGGVEEIGDHAPEVRLNRNIEITDIALNG